MRTPAAILLAGLLFWPLAPAAPRAQAADPCLEPAETYGGDLNALNQAANTARDEARYDDSAALRCEILRIHLRALGPTAPATLRVQSDYAIAIAVNDYERGVAIYRALLATSTQALGQSDPDTINYQATFARLLRVRDLWTEAEDWARTAHRSALARVNASAQPSFYDWVVLEHAIAALAVTLDGQQRFEESAALWQRQYEILVQLGASNARLGDSRNNRSLNYSLRGMNAEALAEAQAAYELVRDSEDQRLVFAVRSILATALARVGRHEEGLTHLQAHLQYIEGRFGVDTEESCGILGGIGSTLFEMQRVEEGLAYKRRALACQERRRAGPRNRDAASQATDLAATLLAAGQNDEAFRMAELGYSIRRELPSLPQASYVAKRAENMGRNNAAMIYLLAAHAYIAASPERAAGLYASIFDAMQLRGESETTAAMSFGSAFVGARDAGLSEAVAEWRAAEVELADIDRRFAIAANSGRGGDGDRLTLAEQRQIAMERKAASEATLRASYPAFFEMASPQSTSLPEAQALLGADEALFIITPGDPRLPVASLRMGFVLALTREGVAFAQLGRLPDQLRADIAALHGMLESNGQTRAPGVGGAASLLSGARAFDRARAHALYEALFGDPRITRLTAAKSRWTIAAQGIALSTPFAALVMEAPAPGSDNFDPAVLRATRWLGLERTLAITPSVSTLRVQRGMQVNAAPEQWSFFGVGDPAFSGAPGDGRALEMRAFFQDRAANVDAIRNLPSLPGTGDEIRELAGALGAGENDYILGVAATEAELRRRSNQLGRAQIVAFATHGLIAGDLSGTLAEPALALTPPVQPSPEDDGLLTASEAAQLRLRARWVILSACNTASGGEPGADGLTGLARAFFYAGARTLLVSQWPVDDQAARLLTTRAVTLQRDSGLSSADSMRQAMAALAADTSRDAQRRSFAHPSAWAPFLLVSGE